MTTRNDGSRRGPLLAAALLLAAAGARAAAPVSGIVISLEGRPKVQPAGEKSAKRLKVNEMVREGDVVTTGAGERVGIAFVGGAELRINENSSFRMESGGGAKPSSVYTLFGDAWTRLLHGHSGMQVRTPTAVAAVRGTEADVDYNGGPMTVKVYEGLVDVMNDQGTTPLRAGQQTQVSGAGVAPQPARAMSPQDYGTWQNALKAKNLQKSLRLLSGVADKNRTLELEMRERDGKTKKLKINVQKK